MTNWGANFSDFVALGDELIRKFGILNDKKMCNMHIDTYLSNIFNATICIVI